MAKPAIYLAVGQKLQLVSSVVDQNGKSMSGLPVAWTSSNNAKATVDSNGLVTAVATGNCNITATVGSAHEDQPITVVAALVATTVDIIALPVQG